MIDSHEFIAARSVSEQLQTGQPVFLVDVREPAEFRDRHAKGAKSVPLDSINLQKLQQLSHQWDSETQPVYLICESGLRALQAAELLNQQGVKRPVVIEGGTNAWNDAGLPIVRKKTTLLSLERQTQIALGVLLLTILLKGAFLHEGFYLLIALIASGLLLAGITAKCSLTVLLARMPWNQQHNTTA